MNVNGLQLISLFSGFLLFVLGCLFLFKRIKNQQSNQLLGAFLLSNALLLINFFLYLTIKDYPVQFHLLHNFGTHSYLLLPPLLYLYITSLCQNAFRLGVKDGLHFLPYLFFVVLGLLIYHYSPNFEAPFTNSSFVFYSFFKLALYLQLGAYVWASFNQLRKYRMQLKEHYSNLNKIDLHWVNLILYFLILMGSTDLAIFMAGKLHLSGFFFDTYLIYQTISVNLILCIGLIYKGMGQTNMPAGKLPIPKYVQNNADKTNYEGYKTQLSHLMETEKPFLQPELNLEELAIKLNCSPRLLSQLIHVCFDQNFNQYINQYRIEEAKRLIKEDKENKKSIFDIQCDAGFNSKTAFNLSFKKLTGFTPKEYRSRENN